MPNRDGTGPEGKGARTGRELGNCAKANPNGTRPIRGFGIGAGRRPRGIRKGQSA
jgi:hypothetical protein